MDTGGQGLGPWVHPIGGGAVAVRQQAQPAGAGAIQRKTVKSPDLQRRQPQARHEGCPILARGQKGLQQFWPCRTVPGISPQGGRVLIHAGQPILPRQSARTQQEVDPRLPLQPLDPDPVIQRLVVDQAKRQLRLPLAVAAQLRQGDQTGGLVAADPNDQCFGRIVRTDRVRRGKAQPHQQQSQCNCLS